MVKVWLLAACLSLSGCAGLTGTVLDAGLGAVGLGDKGSGLHVDTELVNGDKSQAIQVGETLQAGQKFDEVDLTNSQMSVTSNTEQGKRDITTDHYTEGIPYWQAGLGGILFLLVGVFLPQLVIKRK